MAEQKKVNVLQLDDRLAAELNIGVNKTFTAMFGLSPTSSPHSIETECSVKGDISGIVGLTQERIEGAMFLSFPLQTIFGILGKMYKKRFTEIDKSVKSGVGEMTNIIFGMLKTNLNKNGYAFRMAIPNVVLGDHHSVAVYAPGKTLVIPFDSEVGPFTVMITIYPEFGEQAA